MIFKIHRILWSGAAALALLIPQAQSAKAGVPKMEVVVGSYTWGDKAKKGLTLFDFDTATGALTRRDTLSGVENPSFLTLHPKLPVLYAVDEQYGQGGGVRSFTIDKAGSLTPLNRQPSRGDGPCTVAVDRTGKVLVTANYGSGSVASFALDAAGAIQPAASLIQHVGSGPNANRQKEPHAHQMLFDPSNRFALSCDLGCDKIFIYHVDMATGALTPNDPPAAITEPGSGPRHLAFHPNGRWAYAINELSNTVTAFRWDAGAGRLTATESVPTLDRSFTGPNTAAEIAVHPSGKYVYGSNRGENSIVVFAVDARNGKLTQIGRTPTQGRGPRHFTLSPDGRFMLVANEQSGNIAVLQVNHETGLLAPVGEPTDVPGAVCVIFVPLDK